MPSPVIDDAAAPSRRSPASLIVLGLLALVFTVILLGLGTWQVERRAWKLDLIARVDQRVHAEPVAAPAPARWPQVNAADDEYRRVRVAGTFLNDRETLVQAMTERGGGFWVITPLRQPDGTLVLINRGFVPNEQRDPASRAQGQVAGLVTITGLLRVTEPGGRFLRANDPAADRWYSRDVAAIAAARGLGPVAPYFIDADATPNPGGLPVGGLTVIAFPNSHLVYAITWYGLALMVLGGYGLVLREAVRSRRPAGGACV